MDGMARYVLRTTLFTSMCYLTASEVIKGNAGLETIFFWHAIGLVVGFFGWVLNEGQYQTALDAAKHQQRMNANNATYVIGIHPRLKNVKS